MVTELSRVLDHLSPVPFQQELASRLAVVRARMAERSLDTILVSSPENIFYLTGLDHWGYFAPHLLAVPANAEPVLVTRQMEQVAVAIMVRNARFVGHSDSESAADALLRMPHECADWLFRPGSRIGIEAWSAGMSAGLAERLRLGLKAAQWQDVTGMVDTVRLIRSPLETELSRAAARVADATMAAAVDAIGDGVGEHEVAAASHQAMYRAGGTYPGFGPFIRPSRRLGEEHTTWSRDPLRRGDAVFLELAGCVGRYHAPLGRLVFIGDPPPGTREIERVCLDAFDAVLGALRAGARARHVYAAWQAVVDGAGLAHYRRHHCGYVVGIGFPPSWTGGNTVTGLRHDSDLELQVGMTFHVLSWLMGTGRGDYFVSNTVLLADHGAEVLTTTPATLTVR